MKVNRCINLLLIMIMVTSCGSKKTETAILESIPVKVIEATQGPSVSDRNYVGTVEAESSTSLSFQSLGTVERVFADEGQAVRKGQILAVLNKTTLKSSHDAAMAALNQAKDAYNRMKTLYVKGSLPDIKWVEIQTKLEQAQSMEQVARKSLKDAVLVAPVSGVISSRTIEIGSNVMPGAPVFILDNVNSVKVKISVPENEIAQTCKGLKAKISVGALNDKLFTGKISERGIAANPLSHTYEVKIALNNPLHKLMPGMVCNVDIISGRAIQITVPNNAVQINNNDEHFVWVANNGVAHHRIITVGDLTQTGVAITSGVEVGDKIIIAGNQKVSEGTKITIKQ